MKTEKEEALKRLTNAEKEIAECRAILNKQEVAEPTNLTAKEVVQAMWEEARWNLIKSWDNCPTFLNSKKERMFQQDRKNGKLYYSYFRIWRVLNKQYSLKDADIDAIVMDVVGIDINCEGLTPILDNESIQFWWE